MGNVAYELREDFAGTTTVYDEEGSEGREEPVFQGGSFALLDGSTFDVGAKLEEGGGYIVVDDSQAFLVDVLDGYPALKRTTAPAGAEAISGYEHRNKAELKQLAATRGLATGGTKDELVERLEANDQAVAEGDQEGASDPTPEQTEAASEGGE